MITTIPNYILENKHLYQLIYDDTFIASKSHLLKTDKLHLRNSMHILILLINGSKTLHLQEKDVFIDTTEILFLSQANYFMSEIVGNNDSFESIVISFDDDFVLDFIKKFNISMSTNTQSKLLKIKRDFLIDSSISNINDFFSIKLENKLDLMKLKIQEIFLYTLSKNQDEFISFLNHIINTKSSRIKYILEDNLDIINSIDDMCKLTRLNSKALRKEMLRLYNQNPKTWLDTKRLEKSVSMLKNTTNSISEIATSCGYSSVSWFINQFKKSYKTTPLFFREQNL
ncbi:MAG: AraC family transcriptional regulator [Arcobacteraceae bacterium]